MSSTTFGLGTAVRHAVQYLTVPLMYCVGVETVDRLCRSLETNLIIEFEKTWFPHNPQQGSGSRCLTLAPGRLPPRPILAACHSARLRWSQWISVLGGEEFDLFVDPGCVSIRKGKWGDSDLDCLDIVWAATAERPSSSFISDDDDEIEELFASIERELSASASWMTPIIQQFPTVPRTPLVDASTSDSRCSSRTSVTRFSSPDSDTSLSVSSGNLYITPGKRQNSSDSSSQEDSDSSYSHSPRKYRRERNRQVRVHVDASKTDVTPYDGGKTTVLTGGVMLGPAPSKCA